MPEPEDIRKTAQENRMSDSARLCSPSAARNRDVIRDAFLKTMPVRGPVLEIASGSGEHAIHIAAAAPKLRWLPGDPDPAARASIAAWIAEERAKNIAPPHAIDVTAERWEQYVPAGIGGVVSINMIHIAPFEAAKGLIRGAGELLPPGGKLFLYGPFCRKGEHTAPSNAAFDENLKSRDARWGVRDLDGEIVPLADAAGFDLAEIIEMPANNLSVVFLRR